MAQAKKEKVIIIGASNKLDRYSYKAFKMLREYGHEVFPVHPVLESIDDITVYKSLKLLMDTKIDTVTIYVNPELLKKYAEDIIKLKPGRVIFNPGTESKEIEKVLTDNGIKTIKACTLVMLRTGQF